MLGVGGSTPSMIAANPSFGSGGTVFATARGPSAGGGSQHSMAALSQSFNQTPSIESAPSLGSVAPGQGQFDQQQLQPDLTTVFAEEIQNEANSYFQQIYTNVMRVLYNYSR